MTALRPSLRLLADDLTGALDAAAELVDLTGPVPTFWHGALPSALPRTAALDSGTRELLPAEAAARVAALAAALAPADIAFKKIDSLMRGPTLAEIAACVRTGQWPRAILAPAFPYQDRITRRGIQHTRDADGSWAPVGGDLAARLHAEGAPARLGDPEAAIPPGITVFDAETEDDLLRIVAGGRRAPGPVLWIGTGGLAQALAGATSARDRTVPAPPVLGLFGSDQTATAAQLSACGPDWIRLGDGGPAAARAVTARLGRSGRALVSLDLPPGLSRAEAARRIGAELHRLVQDLPAPGTLIVAGGETLAGLCRGLGADSLDVQGRVVPGVPRSVLRGGNWDGVTILSKSGAFGPPNLLRDLLHLAHALDERTE